MDAHDCPQPASSGDLYARTLHRTCEKVGGIGSLAKRLGVSPATLKRWLDGAAPIPQSAFLKAVDILIA